MVCQSVSVAFLIFFYIRGLVPLHSYIVSLGILRICTSSSTFQKLHFFNQ